MQAEQQALAEEVGFDKAALRSLFRSLGVGGSDQTDDGEDVPQEKIARLRDLIGEEAAFTTAFQAAAQSELLFESGIFDPVFASRQVATADGQVAVAPTRTRKR